MKKFLALLLALCMAMSLVACGGGDTPAEEEAPPTDDKGVVEGSNTSATGTSDKDVYIDFFGTWANDHRRAVFWQEQANAFAEEYEAETGISVEIKYVSQDGYTGLTEKLAAGAASPDQLPVISQVEEQATGRFYPLAADLSTLMAPEVLDNYLDGLMVSCTYEGKPYAVPAGRSYMITLVNKTLLEAAGYTEADLVDWDYAKYEEIATAIAALGDDTYGVALYWDEDAWPWESNVYANGGSIDNEDGTQIMFNAETGSPFLDLTIKMANNGVAYNPYTNYSLADAGDADNLMFGTGKVGIYSASITSYKSTEGVKEEQLAAGVEGADFETIVAKMPAGTTQSVVTGGSNMMILKSATETQQKVAAAYFEYLCEPSRVAQWNEVSSYLAFTDDVVNDETFKANLEADPNLANIFQFVEDAHARPITPYWAEMYLNVICPGLVTIFQDPAAYADPATVDALVDQWAVDCQAILDNA